MSYNSRSGHGYGQQRRRSSPYPHNQYRKNAYSDQRNTLSEATIYQRDNVEQPLSINPNFAVWVRATPTLTQPSWIAKLPNNTPLGKQAFELSLEAAKRKLEIQIVNPSTQKATKYKVCKKQNTETEQPDENTQPLNEQSYEEYQHISSLNNALKLFGYSLVQQKGLTL